jgi:ribosomal protein S18 acetylase RimI-like enzyme
MSIVVRRATVDDATLIAVLNADVQAVHAAALPWRFKPLSPDSLPHTEAAGWLGNPEGLVFIAEVAAEPAGYIYAEINRRPETSLTYAFTTIYIHHVSVRAIHRRKGVGTALIVTLRAAGRDLGIDALALDVWTFNEDARAFFRRHGFTAYNERLWNRA